MKKVFASIVSFLSLISVELYAGENLSPLDYGFASAKNGKERAEILYKTHYAAIKKGVDVDYSGIKKIDITIEEGFKTIPLTEHNDFSGATITVVNNWKENVFVFKLKGTAKSVEVDKALIDGNRFSNVPELAQGTHLLVISDANLWVDNRVGYSYGHTRKDILLVENGIGRNHVISGYDNPESSPECTYCEVSLGEKTVGNLVFNRSEKSKYKAHFLDMALQNNVTVHNVVITTPESNHSSDRAINVSDCTNVTFRDVKIDGTYSQTNKYGYGLNLNNMWNTRFVRLEGTGKWGIIGSNNMSSTELDFCKVNRFDIHCYGRDVTLNDTEINGFYCGGSSIFGRIECNRCHFISTTPFANGDSYKTYIGGEVIFNDCVVDMSKNKCSIFATSRFNGDINPRRGLSQKCLPNITIRNMVVNIPKDVKAVYLYNLGKSDGYKESVGYLNNIDIDGLVFNYANSKSKVAFHLSSAPFLTDSKIICNMKNMNLGNAELICNLSSNKTNKLILSNSSLSIEEAVRPNTKLRIRNCNIYK